MPFCCERCEKPFRDNDALSRHLNRKNLCHTDGKVKHSKCICNHGKPKRYCKECGGGSLCKSDWCSVSKNPKYDNYCLFCYVHLFPDNLIIKNYKTKELSVVESIKTKFPDFSWVSDKRVNNGCSQRRPDLLLDLGFQVIIIEIDEDQHNDYGLICENKRVMEISQDLCYRPTVFIRFNPDSYKKYGCTSKVTSCWSLNAQGIMVIKKSKLNEWDSRLKALNNIIQYWCDNKSEKMINTVYLFYDKIF